MAAEKTPGQIAYEAWWAAGGFKVPAEWIALSPKMRKAWEAAAEAVRQDLLDAQDIPGDDA